MSGKEDFIQQDSELSIGSGNAAEGKEELVKDWTDEEEKAARWKVDLIIMPILMLGFSALQLDRGNISSALTSTIREDLGVNQNVINLGNQLLSIGIVVFEIPANMLLQKVGPARWLAGQIFTWGLVATFQAFIKNKASFFATRFLLGAFEAGYIPGSLFILSTWYTSKEISSRSAIFFIGNLATAAISPLLAAGLLNVSGGGLAPWQWLFLIEGLWTIFIAFLFIMFFPSSIEDGKPLYRRGYRYLTPRQQHIIRTRLLIDDYTKIESRAPITLSHIWETFKQWRLWIHFLITLTGQQSNTALQTYGPSIVKSFGFGTIKANALSSVGPWGTVCLTLAFGLLSDKYPRKSLWLMIDLSLMLLLTGVLFANTPEWPKWGRYAVLQLAIAPQQVYHTLNLGWMSLNARNPQERSVAMAMVIMAANLAGISAQQIMRAEDSPLYRRGFLAILLTTSATWCLVFFQFLQYRWTNAKRTKDSTEFKYTG